MENLTTQKKKYYLSKYIEMQVYWGMDISDMVGVPLSKFNFTYIIDKVKEHEANLESELNGNSKRLTDES